MMAAGLKFSATRMVGSGHPALVVAEIGQNHNGQPELAEQLIDAAAWAGADAVKFTKRDLVCELSTQARLQPYLAPQSFGATYGEHRQRLELSAEVYAELVARARRWGLLVFGTGCDIPSANLLHQLGADALKIASRDLDNLPLISHVSRLNRPVIASTGMSSLEQIDRAVQILQREQSPFLLLQCTSLYPTPWENVHLRSLATLQSRYQCLVGFSDHTPGILIPPVAVALGAVLIEKHLTLSRRLKGSDHASSLEPEEMRLMIENIRQVELALGQADKPLPPAVAGMRAKLGRSLVVRVPVAEGDVFQADMLTLKCPGNGLSWLELDQVVGRRARRPLPADSVLTRDDLME